MAAKLISSPHGTIKLRETRDLVTVLTNTPEILREKHCKAALREATTIFQERARSNVRGLKAQGRDRLDKKTESPNLASSIRRRLLTRGKSVVGRTQTTGKERMYAAAVEYGHQKWIFGVERTAELGPVEQHPFWRPAKDATQSQIEKTIIGILRTKLSEIVRT